MLLGQPRGYSSWQEACQKTEIECQQYYSLWHPHPQVRRRTNASSGREADPARAARQPDRPGMRYSGTDGRDMAASTISFCACDHESIARSS